MADLLLKMVALMVDEIRPYLVGSVFLLREVDFIFAMVVVQTLKRKNNIEMLN